MDATSLVAAGLPAITVTAATVPTATGAVFTVTAMVWVALKPSESCAVTVMVALPPVIGVTVTTLPLTVAVATSESDELTV